MSNNYAPEWYNFMEDTLNPIPEGYDGNKIFLPKDKCDNFWIKIEELRNNETKCRCDYDEEDSYGFCCRCFLEKDEKSKQKWEWIWPRNKYGRWLCIPIDFYNKMKSHIDNYGNDGNFLMACRWRANHQKLLSWYFYDIQKGKCKICNKEFEEMEMELDHILEKINGGRENEENLQMLCKICHRKKALPYWDIVEARNELGWVQDG